MMSNEKNQKEKAFHWDELSSKCQLEILGYLDLHKLFQFRLLSKTLKSQVDPMIKAKITVDPKCSWNPYFTTRSYPNLNNRNIFGIIRLQNETLIQRFVEEYSEPEVTTTLPPTAEQTELPKSSPGTNRASISQRPQPVEANNKSPKGRTADLNKRVVVSSSQKTRCCKVPRKPIISDPLQPDPEPVNTENEPPQPSPPNPFPLASLHITSVSSVGSSTQLVHWTTQLAEKLGTHLTSFTFDNGQKDVSLNFPQLRIILSHLPNLEYLGVSSINYKHEPAPPNNARQVNQRLPPLPKLRYTWIGYNSTHHLHQDILTAYGCQLKRISTSKLDTQSPFTLQKMLSFANSLRNQYPTVLTPLEELKCPTVSSENVWHEVEVMAAASPILWSNLKRLSLHYRYTSNSVSNSALADLFLLLNVLSPTLEEITLDFESCSDFVQWISLDPRPLSKDVTQPCRRIRKVCVSAKSLVRAGDMSTIVAAKFPKVKKLSFFHWNAYQNEGSRNNFQGEIFSGAIKRLENIPECMEMYWRSIPNVQRISVRRESWKDEYLYHETRDVVAVAIN